MSSKGKTVIKQATFLMIATLICRIIGILYRSPLHAIMGVAGDGYYSMAYEWYNIILLIATYSIPMAVSKVMAEQLALGCYRNAQKVFHAAFIYAVAVGGVGALLAYFAAPLMLASMPDAVLALRVLAPTIFLSGILGVLRGYFQAQNTMMPTAISQIAEQIINAVISVLAAYVFTRPYVGNETNVGKYGAAGGTLGTGAGVVAGLIFMCLIYGLNKKTIRRRLAHDRSGKENSYTESFRLIFMMVTPVILATCVYNVSSVIDQSIFTKLMSMKQFTEIQISKQYALFSYQFKPIINIPIALASATSTALIPAVATSIANKDKEGAIEKIHESKRFMMFLAIPCMVGLCILSYPVIRIMYPSAEVGPASVILSLGSISVLFYCQSTVTNGVLQGLGKPSIPVINALIALGVNVLAVVFGVWVLDMGVVAVLMSTILYAMTVSFLNNLSVQKYLPYDMEFKSSYLLPLAASGVMGVAVAAVYWIPAMLLKKPFTHYLVSAVFCLLAILAGMVVYVIAYAQLSRKSDDELRKLPAGTRMLQLLHFLHVRRS